jgi:hypothetical protein
VVWPFWTSGSSRPGPGARAHLVALALGVLLAGAACATGRVPAAPSTGAAPVAVPGFAFATDTFAFPNDVRAHHPDSDDLYANYCFVMARSLRQFFAFARFDPAAPRLDGDGYAERVRQVVARAPWEPAPPPDDRVVIPGYPDLRALSRAEEPAVKAALGGRFWTWVHWTNWRVVFPVTAGHQAAVAQEIMDEISAGRLVQLLVTNWPKPELNHTVVAFEFRDEPDGIAFLIWDPNDPAGPGRVTFDRRQSRFVATRMHGVEPGPIRAFRMYYSPWL